MTTSALILMILVQLTITGFFAYFFLKVLRTTPKPQQPEQAQNSPNNA